MEYRIALLILTLLCDHADSLLTRFRKSSFPGYDKSSVLRNQSYVSPDDILALISALEKGQPLYLQFLYDPNNEDIVRSVANEASKRVSGLMTFPNDGNIATVNMALSSAFGTTILLVFCSSANIISIFQSIRQRRLKSHTASWVLFLRREEEEVQTILGLEGLIHEGTIVTLMTKITTGSYRLYTAHVDVKGVTRFYSRGTWTTKPQRKRKDIHSILTSIDESLYTDMLGRELIVGANDIWPFFGFKKVNPDGTETPEEGIEVSIVRALGSALNFTYRVLMPADKQWGHPQPDGTVTGFIGLVARREAHFAISIIGITIQRRAVVDFTAPHYKEPLGIFSRAPRQKNRALAILAPFTFEVWLGIIASVLGIGPVVFLLTRITNLYQEEDTDKSFQDFSFNMFKNLVIQDNQLSPGLWSRKFVFLFWYLFCLVISALYSGMLTAVLAIPAYEEPIDSLDDLPRASKEGFDVGVVKETTNEYLFREAKDGIYKQTWDLFNHKDMSKSYVTSPLMGIERVLERKYVYIGPKTLTEILCLRMGRRKFHFARRSFYEQGVGMAVPFGAPYNKIFSGLVLRMNEGGLVSKWKEDEIRKISQTAAGEESSNITAITLVHLQAAFILILLGYIIASLMLLVEQVYVRVF